MQQNDFRTNITAILTPLKNLFIEHNTIPDSLKSTRIMPIPKKVNPSFEDFRQMSIRTVVL